MPAGEAKEKNMVKVENELAKYIVDRFGTKLETEQVSDEYFTVTVEVSLSPPFYAWVFQFNGEIRILEPKKAVNEIITMANALVNNNQ